jgi:hypothetical protein
VESDDHDGPIEFLEMISPAVPAPVPATKEEEEEERAPIAQYCEQEEGDEDVMMGSGSTHSTQNLL